MSELKCPFCQQKLEKRHAATTDYNSMFITYYCGNPECESTTDLTGCKEFWDILGQLIRTRKALDIAVDALKEQQRWLGIIRISMVSHLNNEKGTVFQPYDADPTVLNIGKAKVLLNNAIEQITEAKGGDNE